MKIFRLPSIVLLLCLQALLLAPAAHADDEPTGTPFFLLSDATYGSQESAFVRLEAQNMGPVADYGGADVYVYRVQQPLAFLKKQKNLHRIDTSGEYAGPGLSNALGRMWDNWWIGSRAAWRDLFSSDARQAVTAQAPDVRTHPLVKQSPPERLHPNYRPLKAHTLVDSFRYPVQVAKPIQPPAGVKLEGSSSEFIQPSSGNVMIPLGKLEPGLYLVEAMVSDHRATTLVFVSDTIAVTKVSATQMMVWLADRRSGKPVGGAEVVWTDGVGVLADGGSDRRGIVTFNRSAPDKTYVFGNDPQGGIYIAENYYYDSEIYNTKLYAVTDRPLYRPGDTVFVKFLGRQFTSARQSNAVAAGDLALQVFDANGFPVAGQTVKMSPQTGADTSFQLPDNAVAGGYELRFTFKGDAYGAAFRVAEYQKPHFEINIIPGKKDFKTNEAVEGRLQLAYPDGKPVPNAVAELSVRAQRLTMVEGDLGYAGQFPLQLTTAVLTTDAQGVARFSLPAAKEPSRYVLSVLATDGAAYRVRATKELLIERGAATFTLRSGRGFSAVNEPVNFDIRAQGDAQLAAASQPVAWEWVRLENRARQSGPLQNAKALEIKFAEPGTYTLSLRDAGGNVVGATSHYVSGAGVGAPQGSIEMLFDKTQYKPGEVAHALITFPQTVDQALFTLERDRVEKTALMAGGDGLGAWISATRIAPQQWRADIPVREDYGPNITLSVVYVKGRDYVFQNLGLKVERPRIAIAVQADKPVYAPGDKVTLDLAALVGDKPAPGTLLTVGVVDEMIYVLQPEIAPDVFDFFFHPRRNNVRTSASLSFIGYDLARPPSKAAMPSRRQTPERAIKILERPRREDKDTALWLPTVAVDANGHAKVSFMMPDSLTRWRITVRAAAPSGTVGQSVAYVRSDKDFYVKWTSPNWMREKDAPQASVAIFNQGQTDAMVDFSASGAGVDKRERINVHPGANFLALPLHIQGGAPAANTQLELTLAKDGKTVDALSVPLRVVPAHWQSPRSISVALTGKETPLNLPADATNLRLQFADSAAGQFRRLMDDLIDYPYGCVEQTSSRLIPYSLALQSLLPGDERLNAQLTQRLHSYRFRLAQMAGPEATFGWWTPPDKDADAFLTAYAYYADWHASRALKLELPPGHFDRLIQVYRKNGVKRSLWERALMLYWMQEMGLPMRSLAEALGEEIAGKPLPTQVQGKKFSPYNSMVLSSESGELAPAMSRLLVSYVITQAKGTVAIKDADLDAAATQVRAAGLPLGDALLLLNGRIASKDAAAILEKVRAGYPTIDRSLILQWTYRALSGASGTNSDLLRAAIAKAEPEAAWQRITTATGQQLFRWNTATSPAVLKLTSAPGAGLTAVAQFESRETEASSLPVQVQRRIYRMVRIAKPLPAAPDPQEKPQRGQETVTVDSGPTEYTLELLPADAILKTDEVYLDEVVLTKAQGAGSTLRFGIVEVPLPPGATADRTTWGIAIRRAGAKDAEALERARYEVTPRGYAVPIDALSGETTVRHLLRFAQSGTFVLPPARYYRMYQPEQKAFEEGARAQLQVQ